MPRLHAAAAVTDALWRLAWCDRLTHRGLGPLHAFVGGRRVARRPARPRAVEETVWAVEEACVWYVAHARCLTRAAATTWMLRRAGIAAELVIGVRHLPLESHAWVEVDGVIVNDRPQYQKCFQVVARL